MNRRNTSAQAGLYTGQIKKLKVIIPPYSLQNKFEKLIQTIDDQVKNVDLELIKSDKLFQSLLQSAFKGELIK